MMDEILKEFQHYLYLMVSKDYSKLTFLFLSFVMSINVNWSWYIHFLILCNWNLTISRLWNLIFHCSYEKTNFKITSTFPKFSCSERSSTFTLHCCNRSHWWASKKEDIPSIICSLLQWLSSGGSTTISLSWKASLPFI